jgi:hypothetical protein
MPRRRARRQEYRRHLKEGTYPFDLRSWLTSGPIDRIAGLAWSLLSTKSGETPSVFLTPTILQVTATDVRQDAGTHLVIYATVVARLAAAPPQWPLGEATELAVVTIDLRAILDRVSHDVVDWDYGPASIEPLQPPGWFAAWR